MEQFFECVLPSLNINIFSHAHQGVLFFLHSFWQLVFWRQLWCHQLIPTLPRVFDDECGIELHFSNKCTHWVLNEFSWVFFAWLAFRTSFCFQWYSSGIFFAHISSSDMKLLYVFTILLLFSECGLFFAIFLFLSTFSGRIALAKLSWMSDITLTSWLTLYIYISINYICTFQTKHKYS